MRILLLSLALTGCVSPITTAAKDATSSVVQIATDADSQKKLDILLASGTRTITDTAKAEIPGIVKSVDLQSLVTPTLQAKIRELVRQAMNEALGTETQTRVNVLREEAFGLKLQSDVDSLIDTAEPHLSTVAARIVTVAVQAALQASVVPLRADVTQEAQEWRPVAVALAIGCGLALLCLIFAGVIIRNHTRQIQSLLKRES